MGRILAFRPALFAAAAALLASGGQIARADPPDRGDLEARFAKGVRPFLEAQCLACHGPKRQESQLDLSAFTTADLVARRYRVWAHVLSRLEAGEMPPAEARPQPTAEARQAVVAWIRDLRAFEARRNAGDPGLVPARRLNAAEYDYTIRDLTGVDIRPAREFPVDPANEAGFDNSGESLAMSPALLRKYLAAARHVADHVVLKPRGFEFAPHPVVTETDRDKYCVRRIIEFYERQPLNLADYFYAAWRYRHRQTLGAPEAGLAEIALAQGLSPKYLATVWDTLNDEQDQAGPLAETRARWRDLPAADEAAARRGCALLREFVMRERQQLRPKVENLAVRGISSGSQPLVLWKNRQYAAARMRYTGKAATVKEAAALDRFCRVFPDEFVVAERDRPFLESKERNRGRLLNAGFHLMSGYFRDDDPLYELVLDERGRSELDALWHELNFVTSAPLRQYQDFIFFERAEPPRFAQEAKFDFARSEDKDAGSEEKISRFAELYLAKARQNGAKEEALRAIEHYFTAISAEIRGVERARLAAEPSHLSALAAFAERAYRRPLAPAEREELLEFYQTLRSKELLSHEEALRDALASVLVSPHFCYRAVPAKPGSEVQPLSDYELASRLSYFLWSSMPDEQLLARARAGELRGKEALLSETRRMLRDPKARGLAVEFGGNWLEFRRFEEHNSVDRERFQSFSNELRTAMFEEPVRFFEDLVREDRSVLDFLYARHTFVNPILARHYGIEYPGQRLAADSGWVRVEDAARVGRGGLLPMAVFLTKNSPGLRTSPVKRGYWVARRILGEEIPPPPPTVPELPADEAQTGDLTLRELLAAHRQNKNCAACHERFDSFGLVFEGFGPIGERRERDLGGRPVETTAPFPRGAEGTGVAGLQDFIRRHRQADFVDNLCCKLLAYALGRSLILSDEPLIETLRRDLSLGDYRVGILIEGIVTSPQFLSRRGEDRLPE